MGDYFWVAQKKEVASLRKARCHPPILGFSND